MKSRGQIRTETAPFVPVTTALATKSATIAGHGQLHEALVRELAYQLYQERGCNDGHDLRDWLEAEAILRQRGLAA